MKVSGWARGDSGSGLMKIVLTSMESFTSSLYTTQLTEFWLLPRKNVQNWRMWGARISDILKNYDRKQTQKLNSKCLTQKNKSICLGGGCKSASFKVMVNTHCSWGKGTRVGNVHSFDKGQD